MTSPDIAPPCPASKLQASARGSTGCAETFPSHCDTLYTLRYLTHCRPHSTSPLCNLITATATSPTPSRPFNAELREELGESHWRSWADCSRRDDDGTMAMRGKPEAPGAVTPQRKIELFSGTYFAACMLGGVIGIPSSILILTTLLQPSTNQRPPQPAAPPTPPSPLSI